MAAITTLSLKNFATTEVDFIPSRIDAQTGIASYNTSASSYDERSNATISITLPKTNSTRVKVKGKVSIPVMDPVITTRRIDEVIATFEFSMPKNSTLGTRRDLRAYVADFLTDTVITKAVENFESPY
ncbi:coat protein [ssRNA phage Esthiorhiza.1_13]|uniref:Coat protein n=2 Tax=Fiersviridae TaxID=2842319 RepID=A0A8S5KXR6_9VIRU|nr:coat protein [ssRNA phage Esthiorhiza.1_13]QDH88258.1 MAG: hypothetical protein H1RhizoLitter3774_000002 [Leviviridae sp.]DAD49955.1 TPA_asm: coat protein [ssRNA phage Esthiorhiza.1_13]